MNYVESPIEKTAQPTDSKDRKVNLTLKDWALEDRPREKLIAKGKKELSNAELIAILLGSGSVGQSAVGLAKEILNSNDNNLSLLSRQGIKELTRDFKGMGKAKAVTIIAALELGYRMLTENINNSEHYIKDSFSLFNYISPSLIDLPVEEFWAIYLNARNKVLFKQRISIGGITDTPVDIRRIFATALEKNAVSIAVAHNHPTGHLSPSRQDKNLTCKILDAGKTLNINLIDHIIVGIGDNSRPDYYSFRDNGLL
ncbi:MAG: DNA repair protein RadC [Bacteroidales bacterium]|nr:DNA repair protein RadC [Bacteroidales bacterium]